MIWASLPLFTFQVRSLQYQHIVASSPIFTRFCHQQIKFPGSDLHMNVSKHGLVVRQVKSRRVPQQYLDKKSSMSECFFLFLSFSPSLPTPTVRCDPRSRPTGPQRALRYFCASVLSMQFDFCKQIHIFEEKTLI